MMKFTSLICLLLLHGCSFAGSLDAGKFGGPFIQSGAGAVARSYQDKAGDAVSIKDFGAKGDCVTDDAPAVNAAIASLSAMGGKVVIPHTSACYVFASPINLTLTFPALPPSITLEGETGAHVDNPTIKIKHNGHAFDLSGARGHRFVNLNITTDAANTPLTAFFMARNAVGSGAGLHRFTDVSINGKFSAAVFYSYGSEENEYRGVYAQNSYIAGAGKVFYVGAYNSLGLSSTFITIATGAQSSLGTHIFGGSWYMQSGHAQSDVFYLDGASGVEWRGIWAYSAAAAANGRSIVYVDTTNSASDYCLMDGGIFENSTFKQNYGIYLGDTTRGVTGWSVKNVRMSTGTRAIFSHANVTVGQLSLENITEVVANGFQFAGVLQTSTLNIPDNPLIAGTSTRNFIVGNRANYTVTTETGNSFFIDDGTGGIYERGRAVAQGVWTTPAYSAANFTAGGAQTWTVDSGDVITYSYTVIGKTMHLNVFLSGTSVGGTPATSLIVKIPGNYVSAKRNDFPLSYNDNATGFQFNLGWANINAAGTTVVLYKKDTSNWTASTNNTTLYFQAVFEIQ